jgi:hypothetical protein
MGLLTKLSREIKIDNSRRDNWLVTIGFTDSKTNPHFYKKINELTSNLHQEGAIAEKIRANVFMTNDLHGAITSVKLGKHFGAYTRLFKVEEIHTNSSIDLEFEFRLTDSEVESVMKAVYFDLKKRYQPNSPNENLDELIIFLWANNSSLRSKLPITKEDLSRTEDRFRDRLSRGLEKHPLGLKPHNFVPIMSAVETYLDEHKEDITEDSDILFNILRRLSGDDDPFYPSMSDIENLLHEHPVKLVESIRKSMIIRELR